MGRKHLDKGEEMLFICFPSHGIESGDVVRFSK